MHCSAVLPSEHVDIFKLSFFFFFFFNEPATTEIYTLSLHDALPIWDGAVRARPGHGGAPGAPVGAAARSEEHTSELRSRSDLVCRLLLEKKKKTQTRNDTCRHTFGTSLPLSARCRP